MKKQQQNVPTLRFPGYSEEWNLSTLDQVTSKISDGIHSTPKYSESGEYAFINGNNLIDGTIAIFETTKRLTSDEAGQHQREVGGNTLLLSINGTIGNVAFYRGEKVTLGKSVCFINLKEDTDKQLLYYLLQTRHIKKQFFSELTGTTIKNLGIRSIKGTKIFLSTESKEQQKIAAFLSLVDTKIEQFGKKKDLLEQYKKGMMQNLFSQEIRFKDEQGNDYSDWEELELGDLYKFISTNSYSREKLNYDHGMVRNIHYGDIHTKFRARFKVAEEHVPFINKDVSLEKVTQDKYCQIGDLVIADASEDYADIGKTIELLDLNGEQVLAGLHTLLARLLSDDIYIGYGSYMVASEFVRKQIMRIAQGTKVLSISTGRMNKIKLTIPSKKEQQKIADFLSVIDKKIELVAAELEKAQTFKKGLLQQMFI